MTKEHDRRVTKFALGLAGAALALPAQVSAQESASSETASEAAQDGISDIIVTARKREENLQNTPISISAVSADALDSRGITSIMKLEDTTPNLTFKNIPSNSGVASNAAVYIRGIGQSDFAPGVDPGVGIYVDGVYQGRSVGGVFDMIDIDRVEILRGPQGTLFGRNTIGGAVSVTTAKPTDQFKGKDIGRDQPDDRPPRTLDMRDETKAGHGAVSA